MAARLNSITMSDLLLKGMHLSSAYQFNRIIRRLADWKGHVWTGFSDEIGMRGRAPSERKTVCYFEARLSTDTNMLESGIKTDDISN